MSDPQPPQPEVVLVRVTCTSLACPAQWDAWDAEGNYYYLRYRHGHGCARRESGPGWYEEDGPRGEVVSSFDSGDPLDGAIDLDVFCALAGIGLALGLMRTGFGQHLMDELVMKGVPLKEAQEIAAPWTALEE